MTYYDNLNEQGVTIDGQPDKVQTGELHWQLITGKPGSLLIQHILDTNIPDLPRELALLRCAGSVLLHPEYDLPGYGSLRLRRQRSAVRAVSADRSEGRDRATTW